MRYFDFNGQIRAETDDAVISTILRKGGVEVEAPVAPAPEAPYEVALWQFRAALRLSGLEGKVQEVINALPAQPKAVVDAQFEYATTVDRRHPALQQLAQAAGVSQEQLEGLFVTAAGLV